jgi:hypothetical protein
MKILPLLVLLAAGNASAEDAQHSLNDGRVHFGAPVAWTTMMEKAEGNPQVIAFDVPDPTAHDNGESASVTVKTRELGAAADFTGSVQEEFERVRAQPGYEADPSARPEAGLQYFVQRGKTKYLVRESSSLIGTIHVLVRCQRPLIAATPAAWNAAFDADCSRVAQSVH